MYLSKPWVLAPFKVQCRRNLSSIDSTQVPLMGVNVRLVIIIDARPLYHVSVKQMKVPLSKP